MVLAATSRDAAEQFAAEHAAIEPVIFDRYDLARAPADFVRICKTGATEHVLVHSVDWSRETLPQLYSVALLAARGGKHWLVDEHLGTITRVPVRRTAARVAVAPVSIGAALVPAMIDTARFLRQPISRNPRTTRGTPVAEIGPLLAIWGGGIGATVGGSVTHISGILQGFRRSGVRVGLVALAPPPAQVATAVDEIVVVGPPPPGARLTPELATMAGNDAVVAAAGELARRMGPPEVIYQRHAALMTAGVKLSHLWSAPLVLEWNASAAWAFVNWSHGTKPMRQTTHRLVTAVERRVARSADVVAAVSDHAAAMALAAGAPADRLITVPNAVAVEEVDAALVSRAAGPSGRWIGWIGSFGSWHGAEVLVRSIPGLPADVRVLMIGDGRGRTACQRLADNLDIAERIAWPGRQPHDDALRMLAGCDILASPHVALEGDQPFFGSPTKLFEYMALARPIVASRLGQIGEILEDHRTALLVTPGDERELGEAISALLADPARGQELAAGARREAELHHTWDHRVEAILSALEEGN